MKIKIILKLLALAYFFMGCAAYKSNLMLRGNQSTESDWQSKKPFTIEAGDQLEVMVIPWKGEQLIIQQEETPAQQLQIVVDPKGFGVFPLLGKISLERLTLQEMDSVLRTEYSNYFAKPFVKSRFLNKRASIIGASTTQVVELVREDTRLTEVIALSGGLIPQSRSSNIRILRDSGVFIADLTKANERVENDIFIRPGDLIYIEPVRKPFYEGLKDSIPLTSAITSIITIAALLLALL